MKGKSRYKKRKGGKGKQIARSFTRKKERNKRT